MKDYILSNGKNIPSIGFGTFKIPDEEAPNVIIDAVDLGYTHIDTASVYGNEKGVGEGLHNCVKEREEIFLTSKLWNADQGYDQTLRAFEESLERLKTDYLDLYLIHWPKPLSKESWKALERLYSEGSIKSIGVSNFTIPMLDELIEASSIVPMVNQIELHPQFPQLELREYCLKHDILIEAWAPLMQGAIFSIPLIGELAKAYDVSIAQFATVWQLQMGTLPLVKSTHKERMVENLQIPDITISHEDLERMRVLEGSRIGPDPDNFDF